MKSVMSHSFSQVPSANIPRAKFNRSHGLKTTFDAADLVPIFVDEALPGDTFNLDMTGFARMATPIFPVMDNLFMETFFFAVPMRLVWDNWKKFNGEQIDPGDSTDYVVPQMVATATTGYPNQSLEDYLGLPTQVPDYTHSALWHRAYTLIWNEWFRDQNLQDSIPVPKDDGPDLPTEYGILKRGKRHDYFTSGLPWPQKGDSVALPLGTRAPVTGIGPANNVYAESSLTAYETAQSSPTTYTSSFNTNSQALRIEEDPTNTGYPNIYADLSSATAATINQLRQAFQIQKLLERDARGGTRYTEIVRAHFGVTSPDARLQRSEFLGGGTGGVNISPIAQTSSTDATTPQGNLAAMATTTLHNHGFTKSFTEHTLLIGLINVRADLTYQQGLNRMWSRQTRYDFYWPALAHIGEQEILNKEIYTQGTSVDDEVFAYQERHAEYRYKPSQICGKFRSNDSASLDSWHLSQEFSSLPTLSSTFIEEAPPIDRVIAVPSEPQFIADFYFRMNCVRPMPMYSVPGMIDHF